MIFIPIVLIAFIFYYIITNHIHVLWKSLFKKGFTKNDDFYGLYLYDGKQRYAERHTVPFVLLKIFMKNMAILL